MDYDDFDDIEDLANESDLEDENNNLYKIDSTVDLIRKYQEKNTKQLNEITKRISSVSKTQLESAKMLRTKEIGYTEGIKEVNNSIVVILRKLGFVVDDVSKTAKNILVGTAKSSKHAVTKISSTINEDIQFNKSNYMATMLAQSTPIFGYFVSKFMDTRVFSSFADRMKENFRDAADYAHDEFKKRGIFGFITDTIKLLLKLPFKAIALPFKFLAFLIKSPFKFLSGIKHAIFGNKNIKNELDDIPSLKKGGFVKKSGLVNVHAGEVISPASVISVYFDKLITEVMKMRTGITSLSNELAVSFRARLLKSPLFRKILYIFTASKIFNFPIRNLISKITKSTAMSDLQKAKKNPIQFVVTSLNFIYASIRDQTKYLRNLAVAFIGKKEAENENISETSENSIKNVISEKYKKTKESVKENVKKTKESVKENVKKSIEFLSLLKNDKQFREYHKKDLKNDIKEKYSTVKNKFKEKTEKTHASVMGHLNKFFKKGMGKDLEKENKKKFFGKGIGKIQFLLLYLLGKLYLLPAKILLSPFLLAMMLRKPLFGLIKGIGKLNVGKIAKGLSKFSLFFSKFGLKTLLSISRVAIGFTKFLPGIASIIGLFQMLFDSFKGLLKTKEWFKIKKGEKATMSERVFSLVGGALGGTKQGLAGAKSGALKGLGAGMAIGSTVPIVGTFIGGIIGAITGGLLGAIGGKNISLGLSLAWNEVKFQVKKLWDLVTFPIRMTLMLMGKVKDYIGEKVKSISDFIGIDIGKVFNVIKNVILAPIRFVINLIKKFDPSAITESLEGARERQKSRIEEYNKKGKYDVGRYESMLNKTKSYHTGGYNERERYARLLKGEVIVPDYIVEKAKRSGISPENIRSGLFIEMAKFNKQNISDSTKGKLVDKNMLIENDITKELLIKNSISANNKNSQKANEELFKNSQQNNTNMIMNVSSSMMSSMKNIDRGLNNLSNKGTLLDRHLDNIILGDID